MVGRLRLARLKDNLALYRLAFGQPRQEDMIALIKKSGVDTDHLVLDVIDLRPGPAAGMTGTR